jgi:steroid delta-isomerase-like uncharacterized protein
VSTPILVEAFYKRIWNAGDLDAIEEILDEGFVFRGSLETETRGRDAFRKYVRSVRASLGGYRCEILDCVAEEDRAFARMRFSGVHTGPFRGYAPSGKPVHWVGAAWFRFERGVICELWVLGDLNRLNALLKANKETGDR